MIRAVASSAYRWVTTCIGWVEFISGCIVWGVTLVPIGLLLTPLWPGFRNVFRDATSAGLRAYIASLLFLRVTVEGAERRARGRKVIVVNHQSWLDPIVLLGIEKRLVGPAQRYMFRVPVVRSVLRLLGFVETGPGDAEAFARLANETVADPAGSYLFFPEGTRSRTGRIGPFERGAFRLAVERGLPIQPVVIHGLDRVLPPGKVIASAPGRYPVVVRYLAPMDAPSLSGDAASRQAVRELGERTRARMTAELERLRARDGAAAGEPGAAPQDPAR